MAEQAVAREIVVTAETVEAATLQALGQLRAAPHQVDVLVLDAGRRGLFGGARGAQVRVTMHANPDSHDNAQHHRRSAEAAPSMDQETNVADTGIDEAAQAQSAHDGFADDEEGLTPQQRMDQRDEEADLAADFVEGLLDRLDLPGDIEIAVHEEQALVNVTEVGSGLLIGRRGATLDALQELVRCAVQRQTERRSHVRVDVEGYRARQLDKLRDKCRDAIAQVRESGEPVRLEPMDPYERKMMHDLIAKTGGVSSHSEGAEPKRRVVIVPESD